KVALEEELEECYEEQLDSENPLQIPVYHERNVQKPETVSNQPEEEEEKFPLRDSAKARRERREKTEVGIEEEKCRDKLIETRPPLKFAPHLKEAYSKAAKWFRDNHASESLPVFPRTLILHKEESEAILGTKMSRCIIVATSNVHRKIHLNAAPSFCCNPRVARA
ncbi:hypothetical protein PFISCL1PPCAC_2587, partial [Pristionchus fissidentatus]